MEIKKVKKRVKDDTSGREAKYTTTIESEEGKHSMIYDDSNESKNRRSLSQPGVDFALSYYNSPGFKERLEKHNAQDKDWKFVAPHNLDFFGINYSVPANKADDFPAYDPLSKVVHIGTTDFPELIKSEVHFDLGDIAAHELGHVIDRSLQRTHKKTNIVNNGEEVLNIPVTSLYTQSYPVFKRNKYYQNLKNKHINQELDKYTFYNTTDPSGKNLANYYNRKAQARDKPVDEVIKENVSNQLDHSIGNTNAIVLLNPNNTPMEHDAASHESYADYISFLHKLNETNVHDARQSNADGSNTFTKEKLQKFKDNNPNWENMRIFKKFNDDDLIEMVNTVASNDTSPKRKRYSLEDIHFG